ncbi:hypothetical protein IV203_037134 [Nitzschia inconspicua]|uniref:Uncharacterized protein n=1 Tax=Nitzschia inconspicua TaxID=303405 RepID=A0A9K3LKX2_9STRA|nr:hypothetical protein IV203_037134 [Nitzschia inconspicua]
MGNCGSSKAVVVADGNTVPSKRKASTKAFQGMGHRLGSANEVPTTETVSKQQTPSAQETKMLSSPTSAVLEPPVNTDPTLSDSERQRQREARLAAIEKRLQTKPSKKKKPPTSAPLRGPNSEPLMRWQA